MTERGGQGWRPRSLRDGEEPDPRFTLANERTFLAWIRTSLGLMAGAVAMEAFAGDEIPEFIRTPLACVLLVMAARQQPVVGMLCFGLDAAAVSMFNVQIMSVRQALIPEELFGRVQGAYRTVIWGGIPLGMLGGGLLGAWLGLPAVFAISGVLGIALGLGTWAILHTHRREIAAAFEES